MGELEPRARAAMERLLQGRAIHTGGQLTVRNLADEAGIKRATLYRLEPELVTEFRQHAERLAGAGTAADKNLAIIERLEQRLADARVRAASYRANGRLEAAIDGADKRRRASAPIAPSQVSHSGVPPHAS